MRTPILFASSLLAVSLACGPKPAAAPPPPAPVASASSAPKPVEPACKTIDEGCTGASGKRARVVLARLSFVPPPGWRYAQEPEQTVATSGAARMAFGVYDAPSPNDAKALEKSREAIAEQLLRRLSVTAPPKRPLPWARKPDRSTEANGLSIALWQVDGAKYEGARGPILVALAKLPDGGGAVAVGFVPEDDKSSSDEAILTAIESLRDADDGATTTTTGSNGGGP